MICVLYAMRQEIASLLDAMDSCTQRKLAWSDIDQGMLHGTELTLVRVGAGKVLSTMTTQHVIDTLNPSLLILCGISGALHPEYERGDLVIGTEFMQHDLITQVLGFKPGQIPFTDICVLPAPTAALEKLRSFSLSDAKVHFGRILSGDQFVQHEKGAELRRLYQGDVVDMESAAVAVVAHLNKTPLIVARTISDKADEQAAKDFGNFLDEACKHVNAFVSEVVRLKLMDISHELEDYTL
jgi:5'-methylthioadenosine/S-adenosylhomocysteine nucleosidase